MNHPAHLTRLHHTLRERIADGEVLEICMEEGIILALVHALLAED